MKLDRITFDPEKLGGKACIRNMRISVSQVLRLLAGGMTHEQILTKYYTGIALTKTY